MDSDTPDTPVAAPAPKAQAATSPYKLIVKFAFADYQVGQRSPTPMRSPPYWLATATARS